MRLEISILTALVMLGLLSLVFRLTDTGADIALLTLMAISGVTAFFASSLYARYDKTNGNESGAIAAMLIIIGDAVVCIVIPLLILLEVVPFVSGLVCAAGAIVLWTSFLTSGLIRRR